MCTCTLPSGVRCRRYEGAGASARRRRCLVIGPWCRGDGRCVREAVATAPSASPGSVFGFFGGVCPSASSPAPRLPPFLPCCTLAAGVAILPSGASCSLSDAALASFESSSSAASAPGACFGAGSRAPRAPPARVLPAARPPLILRPVTGGAGLASPSRSVLAGPSPGVLRLPRALHGAPSTSLGSACTPSNALSAVFDASRASFASRCSSVGSPRALRGRLPRAVAGYRRALQSSVVLSDLRSGSRTPRSYGLVHRSLA